MTSLIIIESGPLNPFLVIMKLGLQNHQQPLLTIVIKILKSRNPNGKEGSAHSTDVFKMDSSISRKDLPETFRQRLLRTDQQGGQSSQDLNHHALAHIHNILILDQSPLPCHLFQPLLLGELLSKTANSDFLRKLKKKKANRAKTSTIFQSKIKPKKNLC